MKPTVRFVIITALRDRLFVSLYGLLAITFVIAIYLSGGAIAETDRMAVVYAAGGARVMLMMGFTVFVAFHLERLYETRELEALLSRAISRETFIVAYWIGMAFNAALILLPVAAVIFFFQLSMSGAVLWMGSVLLESLVVIAFAIFCGVSLERAIPTIFVTVGFYALARLIGFFVGITHGIVKSDVNQVADPIMEYLSYLVPRLDLVGQTRWLVYGPDSLNIGGVIAAQLAVYVALLLAAAMFDLRKKHF
tara:strand:- start:1012 stop:1764 length:753 start_codon:yes stop_codon:yes gene_type:complete